MLGNIFALMARQADIRLLMALYNKNKSDNTQMIDLARDLLTVAGVLDAKPSGSIEVPTPLRKYTTEWIQESLNMLQNAGLNVDGKLGKEDSKTRQAVRKFQNDNKLKVDGDPGIQTVSVMELARQALDKSAA